MATEEFGVIIDVGSDTSDYQDGMSDAEKSNESFDKSIKTTLKVSSIAFTAIAASIFGVIKAADTYDSQIKQVQKTTGLAGEELNEFKNEIDRLTLALPGISTEELLSISKIAGQLGITGVDNLTGFAEAIGKLTLTTDLTAESAAENLAIILEFSSDTIAEVGKLSSVITLLGSSSTASEPKILGLSRSIATSTGAYKLNAQTIAAFATTFAEGALSQELAGSSLVRVLNTLSSVTRNGGDDLERLAGLTGLSAEKLEELRKTDPAQLFVEFAGGLRAVLDRGEDLPAMLDSFGLSTEETARLLTISATKFENLKDNLEASSAEFANATRLEKEFVLQTDTLGNKANTAAAAFGIFGRKLGQEFTDSANAAVESTTVFATFLANLDDETLGFISTAITFTAIMSGVATVITAATIAFRAFNISMLANPIFLIVTLLSAATAAVITFMGSTSDSVEETKKLTDSMREQEQEAQKIAEAKKKRAEDEKTAASDRQSRLDEEAAADVDRERTKNEELNALKEIEAEEKLTEIENELEIELLRQEGIDEAQLAFLNRQNQLDLDFKKLSLDQETKFTKTQRQLLLAKQKTLELDINKFQKKKEKNALESREKEKKAQQKSIADEEKARRDAASAELKEEKELNKTLDSLQSAFDAIRLKSDVDVSKLLLDNAVKFGRLLFDNKKRGDTVTALSSTFTAVSNALSSVPFPGNLAAAATVGAEGLANVAAITGLSFAHGGVVPGMSKSGFVSGATNFDSVSALMTPGEFVAPPEDAEAAALGVARGRGMLGSEPQNVEVNITVEGSLIGVGSEEQLAEDLAEIIIPEIKNQQVLNNAEGLL